MVAFLALLLCAHAPAQTAVSSPRDQAETSLLESLTKKIDEQNVKIDLLSQQILKLEQHISSARPGIMIGESSPPPAATVATAPAASAANAPGNTAHVVAPRETLTSIAKLHKVGVEELQKFNHIEDDRRLQIGQTIMIPAAPGSGASASPSPSPASP